MKSSVKALFALLKKTSHVKSFMSNCLLSVTWPFRQFSLCRWSDFFKVLPLLQVNFRVFFPRFHRWIDSVFDLYFFVRNFDFHISKIQNHNLFWRLNWESAVELPSSPLASSVPVPRWAEYPKSARVFKNQNATPAFFLKSKLFESASVYFWMTIPIQHKNIC